MQYYFFFNVDQTVEGKDTTTPAYLSVDGWKNCLMPRKAGTAIIFCMPLAKAGNCTLKSWQELQTKFKGDKCNRPNSKLDV